MFWRCEIDIAGAMMYNLCKKNQNLQRDTAHFQALTRKLVHSLRSGQSAFAYGSVNVN